MEEEMLKLKEQLLKEKAEAREEKGRLESIKVGTTFFKVITNHVPKTGQFFCLVQHEPKGSVPGRN